MARVQLYRVEFLINIGSAVIGDILDIFVDTDNVTVPAPGLSFQDDGIETELNGVPFTNDDGYAFGSDPSKYSIQSFNPQVCAGTSLLTFNTGWPLWPFVTYYSEENHYSCAVNPPTCDLIVVGIPLVTHATGQSNADGSIEVIASSSLPKQYKIGADFVYNDGTAQNDGLFSGLLPGQHRIFIRDSANCQANVLVTVSVDNTYGTRFRLEYDDHRGHVTRLDVTKRSYVGTIDEICGWGNSPFYLAMTLEGNDDKLYPIAALAGELILNSQTDSKYIEIFTNDPNLYRLEYYKNFGSGFEKLWTSKVLKQQYSEEFKAPPYRVSFKSIDGLAELKKLYLIQGDGQIYSGTTRAIELIAYILKQTRIELNIRVAINMYALTMASTASDDPLDQAFVDFERFYLATNQPTLDFVLKSILESFGARIVQWENNWCITRVEEMCDDYDYRLFDKDGQYVSNGTYAPVLNLDFPKNNNDLILVDANQGLEIRPSYGLFRIIYKLGLKPNVVRNGDFRLKSQYYNLGTSQGYAFLINKDGFTLVNAGYSIDEGYEQISANNVGYKLTSYIIDAFASGNGGEAYIKPETIVMVMGTNNSLRINFRYKISSSYTYTNFLGVLNYYKVNVPYTKLRVQITFDNGSTVYYLTSDGRWTDQVNELIFFIDKVDEYLESEVLALQPPGGVDGGDFDMKFFLPFPYYTQFNDVADLKAFETYNGSDQTLPSGFRTELKIEEIVGPGSFHSLYYYELRETSDAENLSDYSVVEPDDYNGATNPRRWIRVGYASTGDVSINNPKLTYTTVVDRIKITYLTDGKDPIDTIVRSIGGESGNTEVMEKTVILGSYQSLIRTDVSFGFDIGLFYPNAIPGLTTQTTNILLAYLIYSGYYRDENGTGFETWARDNISEADTLHGIMLKMMSAQYKRSSRLLRGSFMSKNAFFGFLNTLKNVNDNNRVYMPMGLSLDDKRCTYTGEMLELKNIFAAPDDEDPSPEGREFSSDFSSDFS